MLITRRRLLMVRLPLGSPPQYCSRCGPELVRVDLGAGLLAAPLHHLSYPIRGHRAAAHPEPERRDAPQPIPDALAQVAPQPTGRFAGEPHVRCMSTLPVTTASRLCQAHAGDRQARQLDSRTSASLNSEMTVWSHWFWNPPASLAGRPGRRGPGAPALVRVRGIHGHGPRGAAQIA